MVLLKTWYVMLFFFTTQKIYGSYGNETGKSKNLLSLATGFIPDIVDEYESKHLQRNSLILAVNTNHQLYADLECGYIFSAQMHLKLTAALVFGHDKNFHANEKMIEELSFEKEATMMIDSLLGPKNYKVNELWLLFVHACQMRVFFGHVKDSTVESENNKNYKLMHNRVLSVMDDRVKKCNWKNYFNMDLQKSSLRNIIPREKRILFSHTSDVMNAIGQNKKLLHENFEENRVNELLHFSRTESLSNELLLFPDENELKSFFSEILTADSDCLEIRFPNLENGLKGIEHLGEYQHRVMGKLKVIMLQIIMSYTAQLCKPGDVSQVSRAQAYKFKDEVIHKFMDLMWLTEDDEFQRVDKDFTACYITQSPTADILHNGDSKKCKSCFNGTARKLIHAIAIANYLPKFKLTVTNRDQAVTLNDILAAGTTFVGKIQKDIEKQRIRLVQSFLTMFDEVFPSRLESFKQHLLLAINNIHL